jgi:hypothetical protein
MSHLVYHFYISVSPHVNPWNNHDIQFDICTVDCITLASIHQTILTTLKIQNSTKLCYKRKNNDSNDENGILDETKTLKELHIDANCTIFLERMSTKRNREELQINSSTIVIYISTRIGSKDGTTSRRIKILCRENDDFGDIMDELSDTLERNVLKFKFGRAVLKGGKTLREQGLYDGCEVVVVSGRGG